MFVTDIPHKITREDSLIFFLRIDVYIKTVVTGSKTNFVPWAVFDKDTNIPHVSFVII